MGDMCGNKIGLPAGLDVQVDNLIEIGFPW